MSLRQDTRQRLTESGQALITERWPELLQDRETKSTFSYSKIEVSRARLTEDGQGWLVPIVRYTDRVRSNGLIKSSSQETPVRLPLDAVQVETYTYDSQGPAELMGRFGG